MSRAAGSPPLSALEALCALGANLRAARERRGEGVCACAARMDASVLTLIRMEAGDPAVGIGVFATAIWLCGQDGALATPARPAVNRALEPRRLHASGRGRK